MPKKSFYISLREFKFNWYNANFSIKNIYYFAIALLIVQQTFNLNNRGPTFYLTALFRLF